MPVNLLNKLLARSETSPNVNTDVCALFPTRLRTCRSAASLRTWLVPSNLWVATHAWLVRSGGFCMRAFHASVDTGERFIEPCAACSLHLLLWIRRHPRTLWRFLFWRLTMFGKWPRHTKLCTFPLQQKQEVHVCQLADYKILQKNKLISVKLLRCFWYSSLSSIYVSLKR